MALYLVRHAKAGTPHSAGDDEARRLTTAGNRQAAGIADLLAPTGVKRILTSRYTRCVETVAPMAGHLGLDIERHPALAEEADVADAWDLLASLVGDEAVLCSHGNIISPLLDRALRRGAEVVAHEWTCRKGSVWRLDPTGPDSFTRAVLLT